MRSTRPAGTRTTWSRVLAISLAATALAAPAVVVPVAAAPVAPAGAALATTSTDATDVTDKFTTSALDELTTDKTADFWVRFEDRADLSAAAGIADWAERGRFVYDALRSTAQASQADVIAQLDAAHVKYQPFWIENAVLVEGGTLALAKQVAASSAVEGVHEQFAMENGDQVGETQAGTAPATQDVTAITWGVAAIHAPEVWAQGFDGAGITVGDFDTGADGDHPALRGSYRGLGADGTVDDDYNWYDPVDACDGDPCDVHGHGTHTLGTMVGDDGRGNQVGVAPGATWIAANCVDLCDYDGYLESAQWFLAPTRTDGSDPDPAKRPMIINNSWGIPRQLEADLPADWMGAETEAWEAAGIFGAWAAGNEGELGCSSGRLPGRFDHTYAAGAYDESGDIAEFSARGPGENGTTKPDIAAPGVDVRSAANGGGYVTASGTSMASPHLAGAVALLWSAVPHLIGDVAKTRDVLDGTAVDTPDAQCGGTADDNNVWGEGKLDVAAAVRAADVYQDGTVAGTVTDATGTPVAGARVTIEGEQDRTIVTDSEGAFSVVVRAGSHRVSATGYGYLTSLPQDVTVGPDATVTLTFALEAAPTHTVTGTVVQDGTGDLVARVPVTLGGTPFDPVTTAEDGTFTFTDVPEGTYTVSVEMHGCSAPYDESVVVDGDEDVQVRIVPLVDAGGYSCTAGQGRVLFGDEPLGLTGDTDETSVPLPFPFPFYGEEHDRAYVSTDGHVNFQGLVREYGNGPVPHDVEPNAALFPFWDDLYVDDEGSVWTGTTDVDGEATFVIEWRNVTRYNDLASRMFFSVGLQADGDVTYSYGPSSGTSAARGDSATIGLENADGTVGLQYSYDEPSIPGAAWTIRFDAPATAAVTGVVKDYNTKEPVAGATVTLTDADGVAKIARTEADGTYRLIAGLGKHTVAFAAKDYETVTRQVDLAAAGVTANAQLKAARLEVNKESVTATKVLGAAAVTRTFTVTNTGSAATDVDVSTGRSGFTMLGGGSAAGVVTHVAGTATEIATQPVATRPVTQVGVVQPSPLLQLLNGDSGPAAGDLATSGGVAPDATSSGTTTPVLPMAALGETTVTHSSSHDIVFGSSLACRLGGTTFLRTFTLDDFGVTGDFTVSRLQVGVQEVGPTVDAVVNLYTLDGALTYANLTKVGGTTVRLSDESMEIVEVPVTGHVPAGGTLVVEVGTTGTDTGLYLGANRAAETAPTYWASPACGDAQPVDTAEIGYPAVNWVLDVVGQESGVSWIDAQPDAPVTLAPGESVQVVATLDPHAVDQPGTYTAAVRAVADTPYAEPSVAASLVVTAPASWGKVQGTVTDSAGIPLKGAVVSVDGLEKDVTFVTGDDGSYAYWMGVSNNPLTVVAAKDGYVPQVRTGRIVKGQTLTWTFALKKI